ncbi:MAG: class I SAM-dependent methyltransferase [Dehalococcoidia bacterium]|nr:class I SAM-dependent methyltransferase [Dehalococcoidia bacterium]
MTSAAGLYAARVEAMSAQRARWRKVEGNDRWNRRAASFRLDPRREPDANLAALAALVEPGDTVLDVGGGAGRVCLPLALRCREVTNLEPSPAMRAQFDESAAGAGITNACAVDASWPGDAAQFEADVVIVNNVTYFIHEIVPFLAALERAARRLVVISVWSVPPPDHPAALYELAQGERLEPAPSYRELLPVLWEMGILADVRVLPEPFRVTRGSTARPTREAALAYAAETIDADPADADLRATLDAHFDELFALEPGGGFRPAWVPVARELLISWQPSR